VDGGGRLTDGRDVARRHRVRMSVIGMQRLLTAPYNFKPLSQCLSIIARQLPRHLNNSCQLLCTGPSARLSPALAFNERYQLIVSRRLASGIPMAGMYASGCYVLELKLGDGTMAPETQAFWEILYRPSTVPCDRGNTRWTTYA
jgi:hypothetical protein